MNSSNPFVTPVIMSQSLKPPLSVLLVIPIGIGIDYYLFVIPVKRRVNHTGEDCLGIVQYQCLQWFQIRGRPAKVKSSDTDIILHRRKQILYGDFIIEVFQDRKSVV